MERIIELPKGDFLDSSAAHLHEYGEHRSRFADVVCDHSPDLVLSAFLMGYLDKITKSQVMDDTVMPLQLLIALYTSSQCIS